jgi:hypothetical protein
MISGNNIAVSAPTLLTSGFSDSGTKQDSQSEFCDGEANVEPGPFKVIYETDTRE